MRYAHLIFLVTFLPLLTSVLLVQPNFDAAVEPFDFCMQKTGGTPKFGKVVYGEHLVGKVGSNFRY